MLFQQPGESPYDLRFNLLGFDTRVAWGFWVIAIFLGYDLSRMVDDIFGQASPGTLPLLVIWCGCILVSILIHELGHALAFRMYGIDASIVLYHFGGLAIPSAMRRGGRGFGRVSYGEELVIALAGPVFQIGSAMLLCGVVWTLGYHVRAFHWFPGPLDRLGGIGTAELDGAGAFALVTFYVLPSIFWGVLNLVPVLPLDGGRIAQSMIVLSGGDPLQARWLGVIAAVVIAIVAFQSGQMFLGIFFVWMAIDNYQSIYPGGGWR